jgi:hemolysin activation/secretion protein
MEREADGLPGSAGLQFRSGIELVPKAILDQKTKAFASYPQLKAPSMTDAMNGSISWSSLKLQAAIKAFQPESVANSSFDTNYNVLLGNDEVASVEMVEYLDVGGAHPNSRFWTVNYNLKTNRPLSLNDVFREGDEYNTVIAEFAAKDINRRAEQMDRQEARRNNRQPEKRDER